MQTINYTMEEMIPIVAKLTEQYTGHESTSVTYETANQLMGAVIYCIREYETASDLQEVEIGIRTALVINRKVLVVFAFVLFHCS